MKYLIITLLILISCQVVQAEDWVKWVQQRQIEVKQYNDLREQYRCNGLKADINSSLVTLKENWEIYNDKSLVKDSAQQALNNVTNYISSECLNINKDLTTYYWDLRKQLKDFISLLP